VTLNESEAPHSSGTHDGKLRDEAKALDAKLVASGRSGRRDAAAAQEELSFSEFGCRRGDDGVEEVTRAPRVRNRGLSRR
jgi:hypothetical protein